MPLFPEFVNQANSDVPSLPGGDLFRIERVERTAARRRLRIANGIGARAGMYKTAGKRAEEPGDLFIRPVQAFQRCTSEGQVFYELLGRCRAVFCEQVGTQEIGASFAKPDEAVGGGRQCRWRGQRGDVIQVLAAQDSG